MEQMTFACGVLGSRLFLPWMQSRISQTKPSFEIAARSILSSACAPDRHASSPYLNSSLLETCRLAPGLLIGLLIQRRVPSLAG